MSEAICNSSDSAARGQATNYKDTIQKPRVLLHRIGRAHRITVEPGVGLAGPAVGVILIDTSRETTLRPTDDFLEF